MEQFSNFVKKENDIRKSLRKIPDSHRKMAEKFKVKFENGHTLEDDPKHVGSIVLQGKKREISLASPWFFGKEFVFLHEIGHLVWDNIVKNTKLEQEWKKIWEANKKRNKKDSAEESFCHAYAATYAKYPPTIYSDPSWSFFIRKIS